MIVSIYHHARVYSFLRHAALQYSFIQAGAMLGVACVMSPAPVIVFGFALNDSQRCGVSFQGVRIGKSAQLIHPLAVSVSMRTQRQPGMADSRIVLHRKRRVQ